MNTSNRVKEIQNVRTQLLPFGEVGRGSFFNAFNCMKAYSYSGERYGYYGYDDQGERTYKMDITFLGIWTNEQGEISDNWEVSTLMLYPNGYLNINQNGEYTKHYYADALRIASKIGTGFSGNICDSAGVIENAYPGYLSDRILKQNEVMQNELYEVALKNPSATLNFVNPYSDFCSIGSGGQETGLFFYHADHLGSTGMVTDINSQITQGLLYAPFGEIITDYQPQFHSTPMPNYAFNAKELDEENGMYYYSARYYAPPTFISRDPMFEKYPSISPYCYCANNPMKYVDPTGETIWVIGDDGQKTQYNPNEIYEGTDAFRGEVSNAINSIGKTEEGEKMINELHESTNEFIIVKGNSSGFKEDSKEAYVTEDGTTGKGSGGTITWNPSGATLPVVGGSGVNAITDLGHEMFHGLDANRGLLDDRKVNGIKRSEWQAVYRENNLRTQMGAPLRTFYNVIQDQYGNFIRGEMPFMLSPTLENIYPSWYKK